MKSHSLTASSLNTLAHVCKLHSTSSGVKSGWHGVPCDAGTCEEGGYMSPWAVKCKERLQDLLAQQKGRDQKIEYGAWV